MGTTTTDDLLRAYAERIEALDREIAAKSAERDGLAKAREALQGDLTKRNRRDTESGMPTMHPVERVQHSKPRGRRETKALRDAAHAAGFTLRMLATRIGTSQAQLSLAAVGDRPISPAIAKQVEKLTGYPATSWPRVNPS